VDIESRVERLQTCINEGRLTRREWSGHDAQGREVACLLAALSPEAGEAKDSEACPAEVMPAWFANLTPWIDDSGSTAEWPCVVRRYAACAARWSALDEAAWRRVEVAARRAAMVEAMSHATDERVLDACRGVLVWLDDDMPESSRTAVAAAAETARTVGWAAWVARAAAGTARTAGWVARAARAAAGTAGSAAWVARAAEAAGSAAGWAAWAAREAGGTARWVAREVAREEAADRIIDAVLSALEKECGL
jgi:hypothetical protein